MIRNTYIRMHVYMYVWGMYGIVNLRVSVRVSVYVNFCLFVVVNQQIIFCFDFAAFHNINSTLT